MRFIRPLLFAGALLPLPAGAHLVTTGLGPIYDGIGHFFISIGELLPLLALTLLAGMQGAEGGRRVVLVLPPVWLGSAFLGLFAGLLLAARLESLAPPLATLLLGVLVAVDRRLSPALLTALVVVVAVLMGLLGASGLASQAEAGKLLIGSVAAQFVVVSLLAGAIVGFTGRVKLTLAWQRIVVRVIGSWLAAAGLLMLGWTLR